MSISSEIRRISNAKTAIAESIANKGVTVPGGTKIDGMATLIDSILTGGVPIDVPTAAEMESILSNATAQTAGIIYKYTGTTTDKYINGNLYIVEQSGSAYVFVGLNETVAVQYNLTNCSVAPAPQVTAVGQPFGLNITADSGYKIDGNSTLTVTMGGAAVAQTDKNKVYIASVSGNIIITASATVAALAAPTITLSGSVISWAAVSNATAYRIIATADTAKQTDTTSTSFDLSTWSDLTAGTWTIRVLSTNGTVYSDSSNTVTYIVQDNFATATPQELKNTVIMGQAATLYAVGATKQITLKNGQTITLRLANNTTDLYDYADGSGTTGFVLEFVECFGTEYRISSTGINDGGWNACYMRTTVMPLILAQLPDEWQEVVATVKIKTGNGYATGNAVIESDDKLFLPAEREISDFPGDSAQTEWNALTRWQWYAQHDTAEDRIKTYNGSAVAWWERSPINGSSNYFCNVGEDGYIGSASAYSVAAVAPAFCI